MGVARKVWRDLSLEVGMGIKHLCRAAAGKIDFVQVDRPEASILERLEVEGPVFRVNNKAPDRPRSSPPKEAGIRRR